jgi:LysM repeat protein
MVRKIIFGVIGMVMMGSGQLLAFVEDSLRVEYVDGQAYIIHQVDPGETLYSISKRYNTSMNTIAEASPEVKKGLHDGMILRIPFTPRPNEPLRQQIHTVAQGETLYSISRIYDISVIEIMEWNDLLSSDLEVGQKLKIGGTSPPPKIDFIRDGKKIHVVQAGEGLYALARNYDVSVDDLVAWNELESSALNLGQEVIVGIIGEEQEVATTEAEVVETEPVEPAEVTTAGPVVRVKKHENGLAAGIEGADGNDTYLGMHRSIEVGSLVAVRNEMNNQVVFVRIVGKLPDTGINDKVIIRLSPAAVKQLHAIDPKFRVEITYLEPEE